MNPLHALQIVNDLALSLVGESEPDALTAGFMQRLLYHTGFASALLLERATQRAGVSWVLAQGLGNRDLARRVGSGAAWLEGLASGSSAMLDQIELPPDAFQGCERYHQGLRLRASGDLALVLLGPSAPVHASHLPALFEALLPRFARAYSIARERAEHARHLTAEVERRRRLEMSQRESEEQARALLELSPQPILVVDLASRRSLVINARARELLGLASSEPFEAHVVWQRAFPEREYRHEVRAALRARALQALRSGGRLEPMTVRVASAEGGERHVEIHAHIVGGKALVSVVDLTDHLRQEDSLRGAKELAERASSAKSQFLSSVSHELRTPLNAILGFAQLLETDESAAEVHRAHAREILESGYHLLALVDDVLDLTRIESGRVSVSLGAVPLEEAVRESLTLVEAQAQVRSVSIVVADEWPAAVIADHTRLRQVLINLLSNAVKYNVAGGQVEVGCEVLEGAAPKVRVSVRDSGPGIPEKRMSELFQPFNRLGAEGLGVEGTGIGLVVAKQLLELMGGVIGAESRLGEGSTFWFDLPLASSADPSARVGPATTPRTVRKERTPVAARRPRILVAEDQPMNQRLLCLQLEQVGAFDVVVVQHGAQALDRWQGGDVDLILTDCNMPFIDGYRLAAAVREREKHLARHVPIIAVTASAMKEDIDRCLAAGMDACLPKPLSVASLGEALEKWLPPESARGRDARPVDPRRSYVAALEAMIGPAGRARAEELLDGFVGSTEGLVIEARHQLELGLAGDVGKTMHKLKPSAQLVGASVLGTFAGLLEDAGKNDDLQTQKADRSA